MYFVKCITLEVFYWCTNIFENDKMQFGAAYCYLIIKMDFH